jgi:putative endonuclease
MYSVYVLWNGKLSKRYAGSTQDLSKRLRQHNSGKSKFTIGGIPWKIVYSESLPDVGSARRRENFLKTGVGRKWLDDLLK